MIVVRYRNLVVYLWAQEEDGAAHSAKCYILREKTQKNIRVFTRATIAPMPAKKFVVISFLGTTLDAGMAEKRWERWRPTVALAQHKRLHVDRLELLHQSRFEQLAHFIADDVKTVSPKTKVRTHAIEFNDPWDFEEVYSTMFDFVRGYTFNTETEEYFLNITTGTHVQQICSFLLTEAHYIPARLLQLSPPKHEQRGKEPGTFSLIDLDLSRYDRIAQRFALQKEESLDFLKSGIKTRNKPFNKLIEQIERVAVNSRAPILLMGPTGAGKSQLAKRIYELKKERRQVDGAFVEVNCATLRGDAAMSTLFGHKKGAFTGAMNDREGLLRSADKGILFLDEIGELGSDEQAMLLRALEEKSFYPVGSDREVQSDFQLIAGTNRDLRNDVVEKRFRDDLLARINLWSFDLPGLHKRNEDIEPNLEYELERFAERNNLQARFNTEAKRKYLSFAQSPEALWSANFRDLNASVTRMATLSVGGRITEEVVKEEIARLKRSWRTVSKGSYRAVLEEFFTEEEIEEIDLFDQVQLAAVIEICRDAKTLADAGRKLYAVTRNKKRNTNDSDRLAKYLLRFGLSWKKIAEE